MREGLHLFQSNSYAVLKARLLADLEQAPPDPFTPEHIIVPGTAIRRDLEQACAQHFGVAANLSFNFLAQWVWEQIGRFVPVASESPFTGERLPWRLYRAFGDPEINQAGTRLSGYLAHAERDPVMRFELAQRVADVLEQCATWRSNWMRSWSQGRTAGPRPMQDEDWLAALWRWLAREMALPVEHPAAAFFERLGPLTPTEAAAAGLPARLALFCPGDIAPLYLDALAKLGQWMEIRLYLQNPCREFWDLIVGPKRLAQLQQQDAADLHEIGHPLLASWGRQTQGLSRLLGTIPAWASEDAVFLEHEGDSLLASVQNRILALETDAPGGVEPAANDRSIQIHVCHSLVRQLEVLHDQLLDRFAAQPGLRADQVLVVMPDPARHAPLVHAVFGSQEARRIPYQLVGLPRAEANPVARGMLMLLRLLASRCVASEVFHLLREPAVSAGFGLDDASLESLHEWIGEAGIRWGLSEAHRAQVGLPASREFSFADGLDRLFLGFAMPDDTGPWAGLLPVRAAEGTEAAALGALDAYVRRLEGAQREAARHAQPIEWGEHLEAWLQAFFPASRANADMVAEVRRAIQALVTDLVAAGIEEPLPFSVIHKAFGERLEDPAHGAVPTGMVTFAGMTPMRHLPWEIVCVLGMEDGVYPALHKPDEFDLIARAPQPGDRQRRLDDRNVFLDLLLAARSCFLVSYTGRHIRDDSELTPSVLVSELLEHLGHLISGEEGPLALAAARKRFVVEHPLQAFSPRYFLREEDKEAGLFSYAQEYLDALRAREAGRRSVRPQQGDAPPAEEAQETATAVGVAASPADENGEEDAGVSDVSTPFFIELLPVTESATCVIGLADLQDFFRNPARHLLRRSLQVTLREAEEELEDEEPFAVEWASRSALAARLLPALQAGAPDEMIVTLAEAGREYPVGALGRSLLLRELPALRQYAARVPVVRRGPPMWSATGHFEAKAAGMTVILEDTLVGVEATGLGCYRYSSPGAFDKLETWLKHVFFNAAHASGTCDPPRVTRWLGRDSGFAFRPCAEAEGVLHSLLALYAQGQRLPLRFSPRTALTYIERLSEGRERALRKARKEWLGQGERHATWGKRGESDSPAWRIALRHDPNPLNEEFERAACAVFEPLLAHLEEET
ncbi:MAG: exodeoxyribonuclease V subunit gamma [Gammaproteobacteria bacterium]|nr:exodeoxyribonuclease V subunit gamma [Gammaproteobacteria bacterium]